MSGICGILSLKGDDSINKNTLLKMGEIIRHRGPDGSESYIDGAVGLYHNLLKFRLNDTKQPIHNEDHSIQVVFDGIIDNYLELKKNLERKGHKFYTDSEAEVIVHSYEDNKEGCVKLLEGFFAFAIWDSENKKLILVRDRSGIKPLYYAIADSAIYFASEIKSILQCGLFERTPNLKYLYSLLRFGYNPTETMIEKIYQVPASNMLICQKDSISVTEYWNLVPRKILNNSEEYFIEKLYAFLKGYLERLLDYDYRTGVFLSGGLDSSSFVAILSESSKEPIHTFSFSYEDEKLNELKYSRIVAERFNTLHHEVAIKTEDIKYMPRLMWYDSQPNLSSYKLPYFFLSKLANKYDCRFIPIGQGPDYFLGWPPPTSNFLNFLELSERIVPEKLRRNLIWLPFHPISYFKFTEKKFWLPISALGFIKTKNPLLFQKYKDSILSNHFQIAIRNLDYESFYKHFENKKLNNLYQLAGYILFKKIGFVENSLNKINAANSIESLYPFLNHKYAEFASTIPMRFTFTGKALIGKYLLKKSMKNKLPREIIHRIKFGTMKPTKPFIEKEKDTVVHFLSELDKRGYFKKKYINNLLKGENRVKNSEKIFKLFMLEIWHRIFIDSENFEKPNLSLSKLW